MNGGFQGDMTKWRRNSVLSADKIRVTLKLCPV